jgi:succinate semialdehyde reductase
MWTIKQPPKIIFGKNSVQEFSFPKKCLVITSKGARSRGWLEHTGLSNQIIFDTVESNPSLETTEKIISKFKNFDFSHIVGIGGGSSMDVAKFCAFKMNKKKIMIPTTFGSGSEVTRISVLKVDGKKQSFHNDDYFADVAIVDPHFIINTSYEIIKNSAIDACAQCSEAFDSLNGNQYTRFLCEKAFVHLENSILNDKFDELPYGSLLTGLGFGNSSTTLGHALSYVFSNEGYSHGHALAFTTTIAHKFNRSKFYERFKNIVKKLDFKQINLQQNLEEASDLILQDRKHLENNPNKVHKKDIMSLLNSINSGKV